MARLQVIAFGKLKTPGLRQTADYYLKLIQPWIKVEERELKPIPLPNKSPATRLQVQKKEAKLLLDESEAGLLYLLDETGKSLTTRGWADWARKLEDSGSRAPNEGSGAKTISVVIGSSVGFDSDLKKRAAGLLSLGPQTLSHDLARTVLLEQLYRAWSVLRGHPYHNEGA